MVIRIRCSDPVGLALMRMFAVLESVRTAGDDDFSFETDSDPKERAQSARTHYVAKLPRLADGTFDMARIPATVRDNMISLGAETMTGMVYQVVVDSTLKGERVIEKELREAKDMKAGTSQRIIGNLCRMGLVERHAISE